MRLGTDIPMFSGLKRYYKIEKTHAFENGVVCLNYSRD